MCKNCPAKFCGAVLFKQVKRGCFNLVVKFIAMITLENDTVIALIAEKGAELQSLIKKDTGIEYMWSGDAKYWGKYSPVLFPVVGGLKDETYYYNDKAYQLPRHGFARDKNFTVTPVSDEEAVFTLTQDAQTLVVYPFDFTLQLRYKIEGSTIFCTYEIYNSGENTLLFSVGAHPAFAVPLVKDTVYNDYYLQFNVAETLQRWKLVDGLIGTEVELLPAHNGILPLAQSLFYEDAIVLKGLQSNCITLESETQPHGLYFYFDDFPYFGIWAAKDAPFVCLEPWCGIADSVNSNQQLTDKEGINRLQPNQHWSRAWSVECF
jgi:galactose mutarotase-like enzyme